MVKMILFKINEIAKISLTIKVFSIKKDKLYKIWNYQDYQLEIIKIYSIIN
jgi:hypothetical protein